MKKKKSFWRRKTKTGASLVVVIVTVTLLIIIGTTFGIIAMNAYNSAQRRLFQQQAYLTAETCINILNDKLQKDSTGSMIRNIKQKLDNGEDTVVVATLKPKKLPTNAVEADLMGIMGECTITAEYGDPDHKTIRFIATATYNGYSQTLSARVAATTKGALELSKIFSNTQCWQTPVVTLIAGQTTGDMYFSSPGTYQRYTNGEIIDNDANRTLRNTVYGDIAAGDISSDEKLHTKPFDIFNKPLKTKQTRMFKQSDINRFRGAGRKTYQGIKNEIGSYMNSTQPVPGQQYANFYNANAYGVDYLGDRVFCKYEYWGEHIQYLDNPMMNGNPELWYNDWVEIYMFTGNDVQTSPPIVTGDMYVNTKALIGLYDRNKIQMMYWPYRDLDSDPTKVERKYISYANPSETNYRYDQRNIARNYVPRYRNGEVASKGIIQNNPEHGASSDIFFNMVGAPPNYNASRLTHQGNMFLYEDARIECYDSIHTENARKGIKNNIFAHGNLVIDGYACAVTEQNKHTAYAQDNIPANRNVHIFGDVMCEKNMMISNAVIFGDVYCHGEELYIADSVIYGNVYHDGYKCRLDGVNIKNDQYVADKDAPVGYRPASRAEIASNTTIKYSLVKEEHESIGSLQKAGAYLNFQRTNGGDLVVAANNLGDGTKLKQYISKVVDEAGNVTYRETGKPSFFLKPDNESPGDLGEKYFNGIHYRGKRDCDADNDDLWGVVLMNTTAINVYSRVNTKVEHASQRYFSDTGKDHGNSPIDNQHRTEWSRYDNIYVDGYLFFDARHRYSYDDTLGTEISGIISLDQPECAYKENSLIALGNNRIKVDNVVACNKLMMLQNQGYLWRLHGSLAPQPGAYLYVNQERIDVSKEGNRYRKTNLVFNKIYVGDGGYYINGSEWFWEIDGKNWVGQKNNKNPHRGIQIEQLFTTVNSKDKAVIWDAAGGPRKDSTGEYADPNSSYYAPILVYKNFEGDVTGFDWKFMRHNSVFKDGTDRYDPNKVQLTSKSYTSAEMIALIQGEAQQIIDNNKLIKFENGKVVEDNQNVFKPTVGYRANICGSIDKMFDYIENFKYPHRMNAYAKFESSVKLSNDTYKKINHIDDWCNKDMNQGRYPHFDANDPTGTWKVLQIKKWSYKEETTQEEFANNITRIEGKDDIYLSDLVTLGYAHWEGSICVVDKPFDLVPTYDSSGNKTKEAPKLVLTEGQQLVFDLTKGDMNIKLISGIRLGKRASLQLKGNNMLFIYLGTKDGTTGTAANATTMMELGRYAKIGNIGERTSMYIISNDNCKLKLDKGAQIEGYIYAPNGYLEMNFTPPIEADKPTDATLDSEGYVVLRGSMLIRSFIVDVAQGYTGIHDMMCKHKYIYQKAPLIVNNELDYGNSDGEIEDFGKEDWGFIGFD